MTHSAAQEPKKTTLITIGEKHSLDSEVLGEEREYWVHLPYSHDDPPHAPQSYPVIYLLDGDVHFHSVTGLTTFMGRGVNYNFQIPEFIVVALPNTDRTRDLTPTHTTIGFDGKEDVAFLKTSGGGDAFLQFMEEELFSEIESKYPVQDYRVLVGHSFGGLLAIHALLTKPEMFHAHIAIDPSCWWDDESLKRKAQQMLEEASELKSRTYLSLAHNFHKDMDDPELNKTTMRAFVDALKSFESDDFQTEFQYFENEDHGSVPLLSWYYGFLHVFQGYKLDVDKAMENPVHLTEHFELWSNKLGITQKPLEWFVNETGLYFLNTDKEIDKALEFLKLNVANNPHSYNAYKSLAEAYEAQGDTEKAVESYQKAIDLTPDLQDLKDKLKELRQAKK